MFTGTSKGYSWSQSFKVESFSSESSAWKVWAMALSLDGSSPPLFTPRNLQKQNPAGAPRTITRTLEVTGKCFPKKLLWGNWDRIYTEKRRKDRLQSWSSVCSREEPLIQNRRSAWSLLSKLEILEEPLRPLGLSSPALEWAGRNLAWAHL